MSVVANGVTESAFVGKGLACVRGDRLVFRKLDVCLSPGDAVLLLGRNGSGKSSLLRALAGLVPLAAGELSWHDGGQAQGVSLADDREGHAARTRYLGHADAIKPVLTVAENVSFWARLWQPSSEADVAARVAKALAAFNMTALADVPGRFLSAGQKRRTNLARLVAAPGALWLMDEPTTALDKASVGILEDVIADHRRAGGMVILSTHTEVSLPAARTLLMEEFSARAA